MNRQAKSWLPAVLLLLLIAGGFWFVSGQMTRNYSYTEKQFQEDVEDGIVSEVIIRPNKEIPTG